MSYLINELSKYSNQKINKIAIYTALTNSYDKIHEPLQKTSDADFYFFYDSINPPNNSTWNFIKINFKHRDPRRLAKIFKLFPHVLFPNYKYSIWVDASIEIKKDLSQLVEGQSKNQLIKFFKHPKRDCIYEEFKYVESLGYEDDKILAKQKKKYLNDRYPPKNGLVAGGIIIRKHNDRECVQLMEYWWSQIEQFSGRDQLSFCYSSWLKGIQYSTLDLNQHKNEFFQIYPHNRYIFYNSNGEIKITLRIIRSMLIYLISSTKLYKNYLREPYLKLKKMI